MMNKRIISAAVSLAMTVSLCTGFATTASADGAKTPQYQTVKRQMEELDRGGFVAANPSSNLSTAGGVYLSWRLFGKESLETCFNIYRDGTKIAENVHKTNYIDTSGNVNKKYTVAPIVNGVEGEMSEEFRVFTGTVESAWKNAPYAYFDVATSTPPNGVGGCTYSENDSSVGDLDGDGSYELVLKWDPSNSKDASSGGTTGHMYLDGYELDPDGNGDYMWRLDMGPHVRSGAHETPYLVYDFDGDGRAEIVSLSGPGAIDGTGKYVTEAGDTSTIVDADNTLIQTSRGKNIGPEYYTIFDGETGEALCTTDAIPLGAEDGSDWGDSKMQRSPRYAAAVAYIDGVHPSIIMCRGCYNRVVIRAYSWDGIQLVRQWEYDSGKSGGDNSLYGQGIHGVSVADADNDGYDEIVYGSAILDHDGTVLNSTGWGHGDSLHVCDFDNDGKQEVFGALEKKPGIGFRKGTGEVIWRKSCSNDDGRGIMANFSDTYGVLAWDAVFGVMDITGEVLTDVTQHDNNQSYGNFKIYWDGDLLSEHYDKGRVQKWDDGSLSFGRLIALPGVSTNNDTKYNPCLQADIFGDWREELIMRKGDGGVRVFTSLAPTDYILHTLMHDSQYRCAVAWQNVAYNQPPHTSYFIGKEALATDDSGTALNYLAPAFKYTNVKYPSDDWTSVSGISIEPKTLKVERSKTDTITASVLPEEATRKSVKWTSSDQSVAFVSNGVVTGLKPGTATITATTVDGGFTDTCEVTVWSNPVESITIEDKLVNVTAGETVKISPTVLPENASDKSIKWTTANSAVATVSANGTVIGVSAGLTTVYATTVDGGFKAACAVNVLPPGTEDITGSDAFVTTSDPDGTTTKFTGNAAGGSLVQSEAADGAEFHKDFEVVTEGKVTLTFGFTTGGIKIDGSNWNWTGHEYKTALALLDDNGDNILTAEQEWDASAGALTSKILNNNATNLIPSTSSDDWKVIVEGAGNVKGSAKRWLVTAEFDYDEDTCTVDIMGTDGTWAANNGEYKTTFDLNGAKFKTLKCYTTVGKENSTICAEPKIEKTSYEKAVMLTGATNNLYKRGNNTGIPWSESEVNGWHSTSTALRYDEANGRIVFDPVAPGASYSASKTFNGISDDVMLTYDIDWYFGSSMSRDGNYTYLKITDSVLLGWFNGYKLNASKDGGATWTEVWTGSNSLFTKKVKVVVDTAAKTIKSVTLDGADVGMFKNLELDDDAAINNVAFGFDRSGGAPPTWATPCGITNITVSQFGESITPKFNVSFVSNGQVVQSDYLSVGEMPSFRGENPGELEDEKYSYVFTGWAPEYAAVFEDQIYEAQFDKTPKEYTVEFETNGGSISGTPPTKYFYGVTEIELPTQVTRDGCIFRGWYEDAACEGAQVTKIFTTDTGNKKYYAKWEGEKYTVTLNINGGTINSGNVEQYTYGEGATLPTDATRIGFELEGWYSDSAFTGDKVEAITTTDIGNKEFWAKWIPATYDVTFNVNGGTIIGDAPEHYTYGTGATLPTAEKDGATFGGWYTNEQFTGKVATTIKGSDIGNKTYYAKWIYDTDHVKITSASGKKADVDFVLLEQYEKVTVVGALYDNGKLIEITTEDAETVQAQMQYIKSLTFNNDVEGCTIKAFVWDSMFGMKALAGTASTADELPTE